jgi:hypothetical protein
LRITKRVSPGGRHFTQKHTWNGFCPIHCYPFYSRNLAVATDFLTLQTKSVDTFSAG